MSDKERLIAEIYARFYKRDPNFQGDIALNLAHLFASIVNESWIEQVNPGGEFSKAWRELGFASNRKTKELVFLQEN